MNETQVFDWQGHRGCRGLMPENTVPAFLHALEYKEITTLELDVVVSQDGRVVVSHEPWMSEEICTSPTGEEIDEKRSILAMRLDEVQAYDCGNKLHPRFPEQQKMTIRKPTLDQVFAAVEDYCKSNGKVLPHFNIELKYLPEWEQEGFVPSIQDFTGAVLDLISQVGLDSLVNLQCFHPPMLAYIHEQAPDMVLAYLDEFPEQGSISAKMDSMGFIPEIYSPYFLHLTADHVATAHKLGMKVIPWTINETTDMQQVVALGVDGIITDYPDRIP
ncbi:MAG: glycerophosphodiester phosphodiesterase family protein [Bacteroidota bacterium]